MSMLMCETMPELDEVQSAKILRGWVASFPETIETDCEFNLLSAANGSLNENAHTRILAALLRIKPVRVFFFTYLDRKYSHRRLEEIIDADAENAITSVRCFENYLDACVTIGSFRIIIENKVKGACDQAEQIDRYVDIIKEQGVDEKNIFVLYVTQTGGYPGDNSFNRAKDILDCKSDNTDRLFALSYLQDILPWLYEMLGRKIWSELVEPNQEMLKSGLLQYANYIEGQNLLGLREEKDGYEGFRKEVIRFFTAPEWPLPRIMQMCTWADFLILREREFLYKTLDETLFGNLGRKEKQKFLKLMFYRSFNVAVSDEELYVQIPIMTKRTDDMTASMGLWEDTENSVVQVDVWCTNEASPTYDNAFNEVFEEVKDRERVKCMTWNRKKMIRFRVSTIKEMCDVIKVLGGKCPQNVEASSSGETTFVGKMDCDELLRQIKAAINNWCSRKQISFSDNRWNLWGDIQSKDGSMWANHGYGYVNDWAIQLYENTNESIRAFDVFAKRGKASDNVCVLQMCMLEKGFFCRAMRWDGRVFYRFPVPTRQYGERLLQALWEWRNLQG